MAGLVKKSQDFYEILEVTDDACFEEIRKAYHSCAFKYHPDRNPGNKQAEERFKEIGQAYAVLKDFDKKEQYDRLRQKNQAISYSITCRVASARYAKKMHIIYGW